MELRRSFVWESEIAVAFLVLVLVTARVAWGQIYTGMISGTVLDPSGASIPGATVDLMSARTDAKLKQSTDAEGRFIFTGLEPGEYKLAVSAASFVTQEKTRITLQSGERLPLGNITLYVGSATEKVSVTAEAAVVKTESAERAGNISSSQVDNLLMIGRNVITLVTLLPGIVGDINQGDTISRNGGGFSAQGSRTNTNNVSVDGVISTDIDNGGSLKLQTSADAVGEVSVFISNYQAEYGSGSGAVVNIATKSGTREFHGVGSYFKKHEQFDANNFFSNRVGRPKPRTRTNTWTYSVGGPILLGKLNRDRNKLFFFWNQEFWPTQGGDVRTFTMPTLLERAGDFSQSLDTNGALRVVKDPYNGGAQFPGNKIPASRVDLNGAALLKALPVPNFFDLTTSKGQYNYVVTTSNRQPSRMNTLKIDYNASSKDQFYATWTQFHERAEGLGGTAAAFVPAWPQATVIFKADTSGVAGRWTRTISPSTVSEAKFAWQGNPEVAFPATDADLSALLSKTYGFNAGMLTTKGNPLGILPRTSFGGIPNAGNLGNTGSLYEWLPMDNPSNVYTITENLSLIRGQHLIKAGAYIQRFWRDIDGISQRYGSYNFDPSPLNPLDTNYAYANAALGVYNQYQETNDRPRHLARGGRYDFFLQDTWKMTKRLTLDYGLRMYYLIPSYMANDAWATFSPVAYDRAKTVQLFKPGFDSQGNRVAVNPITGVQLPQAVIGAIVPGSGTVFNGMVSPSLDSSVQRGMYKNKGIQWAPRFGLAWDVFGTGKTAVRAGGGVFYNPLVIADYRGLTGQPPLIQTPALFYGEISKLQSGTAYLFPQDVRGTNFVGNVPMTMNFSAGVQQNIGFSTVLDVAYVGSLARHLAWERNLNAIPFGANFASPNQDPTTGRVLPSPLLRPIPGFGDINFQETAGSSNYHSLQITANRRMLSGLNIGASYTLSRAKDFGNGDATRVSTLIPLRQWNYGLTEQDQTNALRINWLWTVPNSPWGHAALKAVVNDWQISGITSFLSGLPTSSAFTTTTPVDFTGSPTDPARPVLTGDPILSGGDRTFSHAFRTEAFSLPTVGSYGGFGNAGRNPLRLPGVNNWDVAIFKRIRIYRERVSMQFRWEMYNIFNHTQFSAFDSAARFNPTNGQQVNPSFGQYTAARQPRRMQFGLRLSF